MKYTKITILICSLLLNVASCQIGKKQDEKEHNSEKTTNNNSCILNTTSVVKDVIVKDTTFQLECLDLSDTTKVFKYLRCTNLGDYGIDKIEKIKFIPYYGSNEMCIELYPNNDSKIAKFSSCGYFNINGSGGKYIAKINNEIKILNYEVFIDTTDCEIIKRCTNYNPPNILGDTAVYYNDRVEASKLIFNFCKAAKVKNMDLMKQYVSSPIAFNDSLHDNFEIFWTKCGKYFDKSIDFWTKETLKNTFFLPLKKDFNYLRNGILTFKPLQTDIGDDDFDTLSGIDLNHAIGQIFASHNKEQMEPEFPSINIPNETYAMRVMRIDGKLKICSFLYFHNNQFAEYFYSIMTDENISIDELFGEKN
ncbi:hypothetical protein [Bacteroides sp. 224]|uniref:hypothetical protein n=1 Tax=Bacteroides sp. 224 TaxID=2302936 RepID=UPI0013D679B2|nr:hypothetical protein [Bacteroides sp. 224]NDV66807.1 hypothetical protein [Bacteroides sp. 224]